MSRADKYSKQRIDKLKELYINHPDYLMQDLAEEMGLNVSLIFYIKFRKKSKHDSCVFINHQNSWHTSNTMVVDCV